MGAGLEGQGAMSVQVICRTTDGIATGWLRGAGQTLKPNTIAVTVAAPPDLRIVRWDGATGLRAATPQEQTDYDTALLQDRTAQDWDDQKLVMALARWTAQKLGVAP